jgi:hypothetical protein
MSRLPPDAFAPLTLKQTPATHLRLRKAAGLNLNLGAPIVRVRTALGGGIALAGGWDSTWAHKDRRGVWVVESVQELTSYFGRPPAHGYSVQVGVMPAQAAQELEAILADDCLYREPTAIGPQWPSVLSPRDKARGLDGHNSCSDGGATLIEVEYGGRRFAASHACITHGAVSRIISLIHEAR